VVALGQGSVTVTPTVVVRVVTDGHPRLITLPAQHASLVVAPAAPVRQTVTTASRTTARRVAPVAAPAPKPKPAPQPTSAPRTVTTTSSSYPYASDTSNGADPWGFTKRQCVSYVAWRLADAGHAIDNPTQHWGSALDWDEAAARLGYTVTSRPTVGSVAHWDAHESSTYYANGGTGSFVAGSMGHVAWVTKVYSDGSVQVAQYNGSGDREFSTMHVTAPRYLRL
jgi:surface antigen